MLGGPARTRDNAKGSWSSSPGPSPGPTESSARLGLGDAATDQTASTRSLSAVCVEVLPIWAVWAAGVYIVAFLTARWRVVPLSRPPGSVAPRGLLWPLHYWDYGWYNAIATTGYPAGHVTRHYGFFPGWPWLLSLFPGGTERVAVALVLVLLASAAFFVFVSRVAPWGSPRRVALGIAACPGSFAALMAYPDVLAATFAVLACMHARRKAPAPAAGMGLLAGLLRPNAWLVAVPVLMLLRKSRDRAASIAVAAPLSAFTSVAVGFWLSSGTPTAIFDAQRLFGRSGPVQLLRSTGGIVTHLKWWEFLWIAVAATAVLLLVRLWRRGSISSIWAPYATLVIGTSFLSGSIAALDRAMLLAFPLYWATVGLGRRAAIFGIAINVALCFSLPQLFP